MAEVYLNPESNVNWATDSEADVARLVDAVGEALVQLSHAEPSYVEQEPA